LADALDLGKRQDKIPFVFDSLTKHDCNQHDKLVGKMMAKMFAQKWRIYVFGKEE